jgi:predicted metal-dependent hydrolase
MPESIIIEIEGIGPVLFERSRRAKHLNIYVKPHKGVRVAVPYRLSLKKAEEMVYSRTGWIRKQLARMTRLKHKHDILLQESARLNRSQARKKLINRLNELAEMYGFTYNRVFIRNQQTRWGSCSLKDNINLNIKLVLLPAELMDYVILHELVHTRVKSHSREFWSELNALVGDAKGLSSRLKEYGLAIL